MLRYLVVMLIPLGIFIYTLSFGRWLRQKGQDVAVYPAYALAAGSFALAAYVLWKFFT